MITGTQGLTWCVRSSGCYGCHGAHVPVQLGCGSGFCFPRRRNNGSFCFNVCKVVTFVLINVF